MGLFSISKRGDLPKGREWVIRAAAVLLSLVFAGMVIAILAIEKSTGQIASGPDIVSRGFLYMDENESFFNACRNVVLAAFEACEPESKEEWAVVKASVRRALKKYIKQETGRFPVILPVVLEI